MTAQVATDIIIASVTCGEEHVSHAVHTAEETLRSISIAILSFFILEWLVEVRTYCCWHGQAGRLPPHAVLR